MKKTKIPAKLLIVKSLAIKANTETPRKGNNGGYTWVG